MSEPTKSQMNERESTQAYFRFLRLDIMQAYTLKKEITGAWFFKDDSTDFFIGVVPLEERFFDELNDYVIRQQISYDACDLLVKATPSNETLAEITIPYTVNKMLKYIDCKITVAIE
ncbi:hypothetical protein ACOJR9_11425 [Alteromonas sp. A081]|uniref:hypothetical protein n=1 Tax=Alteromonas sp. A081 TaxID=3410269 RepID=UPI003B97D3F9